MARYKNKDWIKTFNSAFSGKQMLSSSWWPRTAVKAVKLCQAHNVVDQRQVKHDETLGETCMYRMKVRVEAGKMSFDIRSFTKDPNVLLQFSPYESCSLPVTPPPMGPGPPEEMSLSIKAELTVEKMSEVQPAEVFHESGGI
jgi:hypothetical protein